MRWVSTFSTLSSLTLLAAGCIGGYQPGAGGTHTPGSDPTTTFVPGMPGVVGGADAASLFVTNVQPFISTECASCHATDRQASGPKFLGSTGTYYGNLVVDPRFVNATPASSYLISHSHLKGTGQGADVSAAQGMAIITWITQENVERAYPATPAATTPGMLELAKFAACTTITDWDATGMNNIWQMNVNGNGGQCTSCHVGGAHDVTLNAEPDPNYINLKALQTNVHDLMRIAVADIKPDGTFNDVINAKRWYERVREPGHPQVGNNTLQTITTAVDGFFTATYTKYKAGNCPAPAAPLGM